MAHPPKTAASILLASMVLSLALACPAMADVPMEPMHDAGSFALVLAGPLVIVLSIAAVVLIVRHLRKNKGGSGSDGGRPVSPQNGKE